MYLRFRTCRRYYFFITIFGVWLFVLYILNIEYKFDKISILSRHGLKMGGRWDSTMESRDLAVHTTVPTQPPLLADHFMTMKYAGRLGNHMFQFASLIGLCEKYRYTAVLETHSLLQGIFYIDLPTKKIKQNVKTFHEKQPGMYEVNISHHFNWTLFGYYQSWRYFSSAEAIVRKHLTFKKNILNKAKQLLPTAEHVPIIGIHVRRGDMTSKHEYKRGYNVADLSYLNRSMNYFKQKLGDLQFVVVSDDLKWCRTHLTASNVKIVRSTREVDLAILSLCDHTIITVGSYGWWGAWLAGGQTVYFKDFPRNNTWLDKQINRSDYYPPHWVGM